jgi:glycosyltransferase involved in cell wall biosynthesis
MKAMAARDILPAAPTGPLRVGVELSILRRPPSGSARWAFGLYRSLERYGPELDLLPWHGSSRIHWGGPLRRSLNLARERFWFDVAIPLRSHTRHADVLLMPCNFAAGPGAVPQVVTVHDVNFLSAPGTYDPWYARYAEWAIRRALADATSVTTVSEHSRSELVRWFGVDRERIHVVYPGLGPPPTPTAGRLLDEPYALFVGATEPHKNVPVLLEAWSRAGLSRSLRLVIVGPPGRDHARLLELASKVRPPAVITGAVSRDELGRWYRGASVFVFPSRSEGFGFPPLEAMQIGVPVVASNAGSLREVLGQAALFHAPEDVDGLARSIERVLEDRALRDTMVSRGFETVSRYRWERTATQMAALLARAAGGRT